MTDTQELVVPRSIPITLPVEPLMEKQVRKIDQTNFNTITLHVEERRELFEGFVGYLMPV
jgi:hypothetical protein